MNIYFQFENLIILGYFNFELMEKHMSKLMQIYNPENLKKEKACSKNLENPSIQLILTNGPRNFQNNNL